VNPLEARNRLALSEGQKENRERKEKINMNKKILLGIMMIGLISVLAGTGIYAYFSDEAKSEGNSLGAGTYNIQLWGSTWQDNVGAKWTISNWAPGQEYNATLVLKNVGTINVVTIKIKPTNLADSDATYKMSEKTIITEFTVTKAGKVMSHMESWMEGVFGNNDGTFTLAEFASSPYWFVSGEEDGAIVPGAQASIFIAFKFDETAGNNYQAKSVTFDLTIQAQQGPSDHTVIGDCGYGYAN
jgi:predicted ribosomally synthesized peptide with SipW-like signal peptide